MGLILKWTRPDTIHEFLAASKDRFRDARCLKRGRRSYWAVYTAGYAAEMLLKAAYHRVSGRKTAEDVRPHQKPKMLKHRSGVLGVAWHGNLHELLFWIQMLVAERSDAAGRGTVSPMPVELANQAVAKVQRIASHWRVDMRYWRSTSAAPEYAVVRRSAEWLLHNYDRLCR